MDPWFSADNSTSRICIYVDHKRTSEKDSLLLIHSPKSRISEYAKRVMVCAEANGIQEVGYITNSRLSCSIMQTITFETRLLRDCSRPAVEKPDCSCYLSL